MTPPARDPYGDDDRRSEVSEMEAHGSLMVRWIVVVIEGKASKKKREVGEWSKTRVK